MLSKGTDDLKMKIGKTNNMNGINNEMTNANIIKGKNERKIQLKTATNNLNRDKYEQEIKDRENINERGVQPVKIERNSEVMRTASFKNIGQFRSEKNTDKELDKPHERNEQPEP